MNLEQMREGIQHLWCQHCRALQKVYEIPVECWYNPLDRDAPAFCASNEDAIDAFFAKIFTPEQLKELENGGTVAVACKDQTLPEYPLTHWRVGDVQEDMKDWRKVV